MKENGKSDQKIIEYIIKYADKDGLPIFRPEQWAEINQLFKKDDIRYSMIEYILDVKPPFPFKEIIKNEVIEDFFKLCHEPIDVSYYDDAVSKFDYERRFSGLVFDGKTRYNKVSDFFQQENRYSCDTKHNISVLTSWKTGRVLFTILNSFWTMKQKEISRDLWHITFNIAAHIASQFRPSIVKNILNHFKVKSYLDLSCGWGDRLLGFYVSNATEYYGFDPSTKTYPKYKEQCIFYENLLGGEQTKLIEDRGDFFENKGNKNVVIFNLPAEDRDYVELGIPKVDIVFTSPPYFMAEMYESNPNQSWVRYKTINDWQQKFLHVIIEKSWERVKDGGHLLINISDIFKGHERIPICDIMCDFIETLPNAYYIGYSGMRLTLRPNTVHGKETAGIPYVEPIWMFRKGEDKQKTKDILEFFE